MLASRSPLTNISDLGQVTLFQRGSRSTLVGPLVTSLQRESYELRLSLQPNGVAAQAQYSRLKDTPTHKAFQEAMGQGLVRDWIALGSDTLKCLHEFGRLLMNGRLSLPPSNLHTAYLNGIVIKQGDQSRLAALDPHLLTNLNYVHTMRWYEQRALVGLTSPSISYKAADALDVAVTMRKSPGLFHERIPVLANSNRIGVMLESLVLAKMPEPRFAELLRDAVPGNPYNLPLRIVEVSSVTPASLSLATTTAILPARLIR
jgi:hypothetical protein